ncbi:MAG: hypothetical protein JXN61_11745 [Sedimentisphaerales bacterium]|nr:hypothetical protein [Sedimentisphaerales bacterium]
MSHTTVAKNELTGVAFSLTVVILFAAGCGAPKYAVWYHPDKTLEQAEEELSDCYFEAFLDRRQNPVPEKFDKVEKDPKAGIESSACECMKQGGYRRISPQKLEPPVRIKSGVAHTMPYSIAGK